jgi:Uma2 family endonuclease
MIRPPRTQPANDYPTSDGKPMAETDLHRRLMTEVIDTLTWWFRDRPDVYVSGNLLVFYEKGNKRVHVSPDAFVVPGVGNHERENYLLWKEGRGLDFVVELTSKTTMLDDIEAKYNLYVEKLAVKEYVLFDPREEYLTPSFQMFRRHGGGFRPVKPAQGRFTSRVLGLELERDGSDLRLRDPATGERLPTPTERAEVEARRAAAEASRADAAEAELARLKRELARLRGGAN